MARIARNCVQSMLKVVNAGIGMVGIAMIIYSLWMLRVWNRHLDSDSSAPWFIYTILGIGVTLCLITCSGHIAAETTNGCCLWIYMVFVFLLLVLEAAMTADVILNHDWEEDFPDDQTGNFDQLKDFIRQNFDTIKWIGITVVALEALSMLLAIILKALGPHPARYYESDDDYSPERLPLLRNYVPPPPHVAGDQLYGTKNDSSITRINSKVSMHLSAICLLYRVEPTIGTLYVALTIYLSWYTSQSLDNCFLYSLSGTFTLATSFYMDLLKLINPLIKTFLRKFPECGEHANSHDLLVWIFIIFPFSIALLWNRHGGQNSYVLFTSLVQLIVHISHIFNLGLF